MKLYHVVAMARNRVIGKANRLPWHFSSDLKHFKELTTGSTVLMGRKTFESIGRPLPNRENFVLTSGGPVGDSRVKFFHDLDKALAEVRTPQCFVIGGAQVYQATLSLAEGLHVTNIDQDYEGDVFYPVIPQVFKEKTRKALQQNPALEVIYFERDRTPSSG